MLFLYLVPSHAQDTIYWNMQSPLNWSNFKASPEKDSIGSARATTGVALKFRFQEQDNKWTYQYEVYSYFYPKLSWYKPQDINYYLLAHEQTHFDISELYARKIKKELAKLIPSEKVGEQAEQIYHKMQALHNSTQQKYDRQTKHSLNVESELEWQTKIRDSLKLYHD